MKASESEGGKGEGVEVEVNREDEVDVEGEGIWASVRVKWDRYPSKDVHNTKSGVGIVKRITIPPSRSTRYDKKCEKGGNRSGCVYVCVITTRTGCIAHISIEYQAQ